MKKWFLVLLALSLTLSGCQGLSGYPAWTGTRRRWWSCAWNGSMYLVGEKTTTDPQEIQAVAEGLRSVPVLREWRPGRPLLRGERQHHLYLCARGRFPGGGVLQRVLLQSLHLGKESSCCRRTPPPPRTSCGTLVDVPVEFPPEKNAFPPEKDSAEFLL